ncbi:hypothetical protein GCM10007939_06490 [Amylibacter marinus]|uniref:Peptidase S8/S53 domain-containing protein n=1 Tax=Amylibacter marinus TaxID=1475483 RepID=A0ABQ5VSM6_9RHOB|nr:S8 family peptidase [Amylibacter marinus]GLQ34366.1 hypothetical protein GCM10007939_06490 [Amylibacter marinus]
MDSKLWMNLGSLGCIVTLSACSGGSSSDSGGVVRPDPTPNSWVSTSEFTRNYGLGLINADAYYTDGGTGAGITVGIIDTGIDTTHSEFNGRISGASIDIVNMSAVSDQDGHGTWVAGVIGADYGSGNVQGVAYEATLLAVDAYTESIDGFYDIDTAAGIRHAVDNGADVINLSLGGFGSSSTINSALEYAAENGVAVAIATGNDSERSFGNIADISNPAYEAGRGIYDGHIIAVGAVNSAGDVTDFSNACNSVDIRYCLVAPGQSIYTTRSGGGYNYVSGTSFAAPHVAGAIAVLLSAYPNLTAKQAIQILLESAYDRGSSSPDFQDYDTEYGNGLLDLEAAMAPSGFLSTVAGEELTSMENADFTVSSAFGNAFSQQNTFSNLVLYDAYARAYQADLSDRIADKQSNSNLEFFTDFTSTTKSQNANIGAVSTSFTLRDRMDENTGDTTPTLTQFYANAEISPHSTLHIAHGDTALGASTLNFIDQAVQTHSITDASLTPLSYLTQEGQSIALGRKVQNWDVSYGLRGGTYNVSQNIAADIRVERNWAQGFYLGISGSYIYEDNSFLGTTGTGGFDGGYSAKTTLGTVGVGYEKRNLRLFAQLSTSSTKVDHASTALLADFTTINAQSAMIGATYQNLFSGADSLSLTLSKPLYVKSGAASLRTNIETTQPVATRIGLRPTGSQTNLELGYLSQIDHTTSWGWGLAYIHNPNHDAQAKAEISAGITLKRRF